MVGPCRAVQGEAVMALRYQTDTLTPRTPHKASGSGATPCGEGWPVQSDRASGWCRGERVTSWRDVQANRTHKRGRKEWSYAVRIKIFLGFLFAPRLRWGGNCRLSVSYLAKAGKQGYSRVQKKERLP